jgi:hypothetical protein
MLSRILPLALIATLALSACSTPVPVASPSAAAASSSATPSPTSTPEPEPVPAELVVRGAGVELYDSEGAVIGSFAWADETATALAVLELAFGPAPAPTLTPGDGTHYADFDTYDFGGLTYLTAVSLEKPRTEYFLPSAVWVTSNSPINGVNIRTHDDLQVGDGLAEVTALAPPLSYPSSLGTAYLVDPVDPAIVSDPERATDMVAAVVSAGGVIVRIIAPYASRSFF